ncbi:SDR family oxidoreductase [Algiphilus aromaticivorans]|uniref:SDR family oxidoreductase n=1 Tax=Algiphilus aromaticivorans TaxID=382454 RepID=UPI0005C192A9|nr:SDR family oxidoreductase [Algiphilus aromaticivorans]
MKLEGSNILLTGATGGIGRELATQLAERGANLLLSARDTEALHSLAEELGALGALATVMPADLSSPDAGTRLGADCLGHRTPDAVIHCAGAMQFGEFETSSPEAIATLWQINTLAVLQLTRALLPAMHVRGSGRFVFVGSVFGSLAFPMYALYSASKFALRGFSEALRRELDGSGIGVTYVAPRYTETALNQGGPERAAAALKIARDTPTAVARKIVAALERDRDRYSLGWAERFFMKLNALLPWLVDRALRGQTRQLRAVVRDALPPVH